MMHEKMMKMLEKKGKRKVGEHEKAAKMSVLQELKDAMSSEMGSGLKDALAAKKVSVMAGNKEDLKKGLDLAKKAVGSMPDGAESAEEEAEESPMHEASESAEEERAEHEEGAMPADEADVDSQIAALEAKLAALKAKKGQSDEEDESEESAEA